MKLKHISLITPFLENIVRPSDIFTTCKIISLKRNPFCFLKNYISPKYQSLLVPTMKRVGSFWRDSAFINIFRHSDYYKSQNHFVTCSYSIPKWRPNKSNVCFSSFLFSHKFSCGHVSATPLPVVAEPRPLPWGGGRHVTQAEPIIFLTSWTNRWTNRKACGSKQASHSPSLRFFKFELREEKPLFFWSPGSIKTWIWNFQLPGSSPFPHPTSHQSAREGTRLVRVWGETEGRVGRMLPDSI